jgi:hypothetical protein
MATPMRVEDMLGRFWERVEVRCAGECWPWKGSIGSDGYGRLRGRERRHVTASRFSWEIHNGPVPAGLEIDHVRARGCTRRDCVNPGHLEPVTKAENWRRGQTPSNLFRLRTRCSRGHAYDEANTYVHGGARHCRKCRAVWQEKNNRGAGRLSRLASKGR